MTHKFTAKSCPTTINIQIDERNVPVKLHGICDVVIDQDPSDQRSLTFFEMDMTLTESEARNLVQYFGNLGIVYENLNWPSR